MKMENITEGDVKTTPAPAPDLDHAPTKFIVHKPSEKLSPTSLGGTTGCSGSSITTYAPKSGLDSLGYKGSLSNFLDLQHYAMFFSLGTTSPCNWCHWNISI
jgi:hypothetical protein